MDDLLTPWIGTTLRHVNAIGNRDVLDFRFVGSKIGNRWNDPESPTLYLAGDPGVLVSEWGRHLGAYSDRVTVQRTVYRLHISLKAVLDLRDPLTAKALSLPSEPNWITDTSATRAIARRARVASRAQAMLVPSIAFLDDLTRWNLVIFLDKMPDEPNSWITHIERVGPLSWEPT